MLSKLIFSRTNTILISLLFIALVLRLLVVLQTEIVPHKDAAEYNGMALQILQGNGYVGEGGHPTAIRPPFYPFFLAIVYYFFGYTFTAATIIQALLGAMTCYLVFLTGAHCFNNRVGLIGTLFASIYPPFVTFSYGPASLNTETLFIFLFLLSLYLLLRYADEQKYIYIVSSAIFLGLAMLTRTSALLFPLFVLVWLIYVRKVHFLKPFLIFGILVFATLLPWTLRNAIVFKQLVPVATNGGAVFYGANNPTANGLYSAPFRRNEILPAHNRLLKEGLNEAEISKYFYKKSIDYLKSNPGRTLYLCVRRFIMFWDTSLPLDILPLKYNYFYGLLLPFSLTGIFASFFNKETKHTTLLLTLAIFYYTFFSSLYTASVRDRVVIEPLLIIYASYCLSVIFTRFGFIAGAVVSAGAMILHFTIYIYYSAFFSAISGTLKTIGMSH
jgi:4-amino-4-deoxy-L-arabinose transferase-like glycosyltransferase